MQRLSTVLAPTAPIDQPHIRCRISAESDSVLFSAYAVLRESSYIGGAVIYTVGNDAYVGAAVISQQLPDMLCIKRKQDT